ncbi:MAG: SDR family NAD(P)-dependent oxidoreductase [Rhodanobacteraceae bacterium]
MQSGSTQLEGRRVAVTGAFGTLGAAVVRAALNAGARVAAIDRAKAPAATTRLGDAALFGDVDIADASSAARTFGDVAKVLGGIDALVNVAGAFRWETLVDGSLDTWDLLYRINVRTAAAASRAALTHFGASGRIVNIGAGAADKASAGMGAYAASKSGVARLTEALAEELKDTQITVNAVLPSIIDTPPNRADMPNADFERWVKPEQLADVIVFLLSDSASAITGALIPVRGRVW